MFETKALLCLLILYVVNTKCFWCVCVQFMLISCLLYASKLLICCLQTINPYIMKLSVLDSELALHVSVEC